MGKTCKLVLFLRLRFVISKAKTSKWFPTTKYSMGKITEKCQQNDMRPLVPFPPPTSPTAFCSTSMVAPFLLALLTEQIQGAWQRFLIRLVMLSNFTSSTQSHISISCGLSRDSNICFGLGNSGFSSVCNAKSSLKAGSFFD